jgi:hypothetical protein
MVVALDVIRLVVSAAVFGVSAEMVDICSVALVPSDGFKGDSRYRYRWGKRGSQWSCTKMYSKS